MDQTKERGANVTGTSHETTAGPRGGRKPETHRGRILRAVVASLLLHCAVAAFIVAGPRGTGGAGAGETGDGMTVLRLDMIAMPGDAVNEPEEQTRNPVLAEASTSPAIPAPETEVKPEPRDSVVETPIPATRRERVTPLPRPQAKKSPIPAKKPAGAPAAPEDPARGENTRPGSAVAERVDGTPGAGGGGAEPGMGGDAGRPFGFSLGEVDVKPRLVKQDRVLYPESARRQRITGTVVVRFHLDARGVVTHLHIKRAKPPGVFNDNTLNAVRRWSFRPALKDGKAVPVWVELPVAFTLE